MYIEASRGGQVSLPLLTSRDEHLSRCVHFADGGGSEVDLSALTTFPGYQTGYSCADGDQRRNGAGAAAVNQLPRRQYHARRHRHNLHQSIAVVQRRQSPTASTTAGAYTLGGLNSLIAPNLNVNNGAALTLPAITTVTAPNGNGDWHLYATDWGSTLSLPNLTTIGTLVNNSMYVTANEGGEVLLPALTTVTNSRPVQFEATSGGSLLDLSALASFSGYVETPRR